MSVYLKAYYRDVVVQVVKKGSMNSDLMNVWKRKVSTKHPQGLFCPKSLLVMDSASSHTRKTVLSSFKQHYSTTAAIIPGGMTPLLQPADVVWNKPFKTKMRQRWIDWLAEGEKEFIKSRKCKSASYKLICRWVSQSWSEITADLICKSFADCGITKRNDDDCLYHETLLDVLQDKGVQDIEEDHTGLTDNEETDDSDED
jgi:hypothetical protein